MQSVSVELFEATSFEIVADNGDARRINARELAKAGDREQYVLERVERCVFDRRSRECVCRWEKTHNAREAQVRLALGRRAQGRGVTSGTKEMS